MRRRDTKERAEEVAVLIHRASALFSAIIILLALLFSACLPEPLLAKVAAVTAPQSRKEAQIPTAPQPTEGGSLSIRLLDVDNDVSPEDAALLSRVTAEVLDKNVGLSLKGEGPRILIYHTHDTEAYTPTEDRSYEPSGDWRTEDETRSVIAVGEELARILRERYGISVIHDTTRHEQPLITTAYSRSLATMERYKAQYPTLEMFIDLHRDGVPEHGYEDDYAIINGEKVARMMFVVGTGKGASGNGEEPLPDFESNYALALSLTQRLLSYDPLLSRSVRVKSGRYNQHVSSKCVLVEVGHNANTLEQALAAMPYLAAAIAEAAGISPALTAQSFAP